MIHYQLRCGAAHEFDGWFKDSAAFDAQVAAALMTCPICGGTDVPAEAEALKEDGVDVASIPWLPRADS